MFDVFFHNLGVIMEFSPAWMIISMLGMFAAFDVFVIPEFTKGILREYGHTCLEVKNDHPVVFYTMAAIDLVLVLMPVLFVLFAGDIASIF